MQCRNVRSTGGLLAAVLTGFSSFALAAPDTVFINARAYTMDPQQPWAQAVAVEDGRISYVGDNAGATALGDADTRLVNLDGKMLLPGFIDTHIHPLSGGAYAQTLSLVTSGTVDEWVAAIAEYAKDNPGDGLIFGYGFLATTFGPAGPTRQMIDAVVADRPVLIMDEGFHGAWANSAALQQLGITRDTPDPVPGFSYYKRDASGEPTGYLLEETAGMAMDALEAISPESIIDGSEVIIDTLNSFGVTALFDAHEMDIADSLPQVLGELTERDALTVRIVGSYKPAGPAEIGDAVETTLAWGRELRGERYQFDVLKLMLDGTVEGRTAAMFEDYQGEPGNRGDLVFDQPQVSAALVAAAAAGVDVHMHAIGDRAVNQALNGVEAARKAHPDSGSRYTICHIEVIADADLDRFAKLGVIAQSSPLWASYDYAGEAFVSDDQFQRYWRYHSLAERGVRLTWGSDYPASGGGLQGMSPLLQMEIGITRQDAGDPQAPVQPLPSERMDVAAMIRGYTLDAAYQLHMEDQLGSLQVGKLADLVVLERDLFEVPSHEIHAVGVSATYLGGEQVFAAEAAQD
ncbi:amidohydrolase [Mangrovimicrobium sediminis]|uniref:Amidohydrolase n=1 Tax=Mangrovimicrobium sediminis TaxID=2562682 RepID=A0A4Z0LWC6_9GAMM|nr:amidohydrolase [Haliea sp. SAOS-164]TGD71703.1 amidohydrolase [Haliea sp. SAOS-164]